MHMCSKLGSWRYGRIHGVDKVLLQFKKFFFVLFNATAESVHCSLFLKNLEKHFCDLTYMNKTSSNTLKIYRNIYRKNLSAIIYRLLTSFKDIEIYRSSVSPRAFLKIDYRYRFGTERFIVPITDRPTTRALATTHYLHIYN